MKTNHIVLCSDFPCLDTRRVVLSKSFVFLCVLCVKKR